MGSLRTTAGAALLLLGGVGCGRSCKNDHPYTPPEPDASAPITAPLATTTAESARPDGGKADPAYLAPPGATRWAIGGMTLEAGGREIVQALLGDFDGDGTADALAIVRPADHKGPSGDLVFFSGKSPAPATLFTGPVAGVAPACAPHARLERVGPRSAFAEIGSVCTKAAGSRAAVVVRLGAPGPAVAFDALVSDPRDAPKLTLDVDVVDRDHDGQDDAIVRVALEGEPRLAASLAFFDRPAGPSRDAEEPEASLKAIAAGAMARAKTKDAKLVPPLVTQLRALYRAMCAEGGAPRIASIHGGGAVSCGTSKALEEAGVAEVRAFISLRDPLRAWLAAEEAQAAPATRTATQTSTIAKMLSELAPPATATVRLVNAIPDAAGEPTAPAWGPLAFEASGKLLVRAGGKVVRVDAESGDEEATDLPAWKDDVVAPDGKLRWVDAYHGCEGAALRATFAGDADLVDVALPIQPRLGKVCAAKEKRGEAATAVPLSWGAHGLEALVAGEPVVIKPEAASAAILPAFGEDPPPPGSPRSPGGKGLALATRTGVLVKREKWALAKSPDLEPYGELRRCVASDDGRHIACIRRRKAVLATLP